MSNPITSPFTPPPLLRRVMYLLPLIVALAVVVTYFIFYKHFLYCGDVPSCGPVNAAQILSGVGSADQIKVGAYVAGASWTLINGVHALACLVAIVTAGSVIYHALSEYDVGTRWMIILIVVALAADISLVAGYLTASEDKFSPAQQLLRGTVGHVMPSINKANRFGDALSLTGTLCLAVAACATLWQRNMINEVNEAQVVQRVRLLRPVLYVGAATLVIAVLRLSATHAWAVSYLPADSVIGKVVISFTTGIVGTLGTVFTLLIGGIYLPAALILRARLRKVADGQPNPTEWMESHGMGLSVPQSLGRAIALLAPLLAGPLGELLVNATKSLGLGG